MTLGPPRPAREITIESRRIARQDRANFDPSRYGEPPVRPRVPWADRALGAACLTVAAGLAILAWQLPSPWRFLATAAAFAGVWAFWRITRRGRATSEGGDELAHLEEMLGPGVSVIEFGGLRRPASTTTSSSSSTAASRSRQ